MTAILLSSSSPPSSTICCHQSCIMSPHRPLWADIFVEIFAGGVESLRWIKYPLLTLGKCNWKLTFCKSGCHPHHSGLFTFNQMIIENLIWQHQKLTYVKGVEEKLENPIALSQIFPKTFPQRNCPSTLLHCFASGAVSIRNSWSASFEMHSHHIFNISNVSWQQDPETNIGNILTA